MPGGVLTPNEFALRLRNLIPEVAAVAKEELRKGGEIVRGDAVQRFSKYSAISAEGFKVRVRAGGLVRVEQSKRKTTGRRPDFGALQMTRALLPARDAKQEEVAAGLEAGLGALFLRRGL